MQKSFDNVRKKLDNLRKHLNGCSSNDGRLRIKSYVHDISAALLEQEEHVWLTGVENQQGVSERGQNKLRTYRLMKGDIGPKFCARYVCCLSA